MCVGDIRVIEIPKEYVSSVSGEHDPVPVNETLFFEVELLKIKERKELSKFKVYKKGECDEPSQPGDQISMYF
jgi:hypothetical protein